MYLDMYASVYVACVMESKVDPFTIDSVSRGYHTYKEVLSIAIGEELLCHLIHATTMILSTLVKA